MAGINITYDAREVRDMLNDITDAVDVVLKPAVEETQEFIYKFWRRYTKTSRPPQPPGSTYVRTFKLKNSVKHGRVTVQQATRTQDGSVVGSMTIGGVTAPYAPYVKNPLTDTPPQARIHQGRWSRLDQDEEDAQLFMEKEINRLVDEWVQKVNNG